MGQNVIPAILLLAKQEEVSDTLEGQAANQRHLDSLEKWANKDAMKFNKGKYKVWHQRRKNLFYQFILESEQLETCFAENTLGFLANISRT